MSLALSLSTEPLAWVVGACGKWDSCSHGAGGGGLVSQLLNEKQWGSSIPHPTPSPASPHSKD